MHYDSDRTGQKEGCNSTGVQRTYPNLVDKRFDITKIIRIERSFDKDNIANKWCDFSLGTITNSFNQGIKDSLETLAKEVKKSKNIQAAYKVDLFISNVKKKRLLYILDYALYMR